MRKQIRLNRTPILLLGISMNAGLFCYAGPPVSPKDSLEGGATELKGKELSELQVTASRETKGLVSSAPLYIISESTISTMGVTGISDAMRRLPGVSLTDYGGAGGMKTISIRGLGTQHTGVIYDGFPLADIQKGSIDLSRYSIDNISEMSVSSGDGDNILLPARAISSASTLSLNSLPAPSMIDRGFNFKGGIRGGSFLTVNPFADAGWSDGKSCSVKVAGDFLYSKNNFPFTIKNGMQNENLRREHSAMRSGHGETGAVFKIGPSSILRAQLYYYGSDKELPGPVVYYAAPGKETLKEDNVSGQASVYSRPSGRITLRGGIRYNFSHTHYTDVNGIYPGGILDRRYDQQEAYGTATLGVDAGRGWGVSYSADYFYNFLRTNNSDGLAPHRNSILQAASVKWSHGRFSAVARGLWSLYLNRANSEKEAKDASRISPSVSLSFRVLEGKDLYVRASYKNIFRMPTFNELYFDHYGSINLNPEDADVFNLGVTYGMKETSIFSWLNATADIYMNRISNKIVAIPFNMFVYTMTNLGTVRTLGADLSLSASVQIASEHSLELSGAFSWQHARIRTNPEGLDWNKQVAYTPEFSGSGSICWDNPWVNVVVHCVGSGERYTSNLNLPDTRMPGYAEFGLSLIKKIPLKGHSLEIRGDINNIFNEQYQIVTRYPMPGRNWTLTLKYTL